MSAIDDFPPATHLTLPQWERHKAMLDEIDRLRGRESQLEAQVETLEIVISRLRPIRDAAFTFVREDSHTVTAWQALVGALDDARYEPRP